MKPDTLFLRLQGPLQSWGDQTSKFVVRRTAEAPTKSGVIGMLCAALGVSRSQAPLEWLHRLSALRFGVRIDSPGVRWWDYHTVGAGYGLPKAEGGIKITSITGDTETLVTRREYLCDASFLAALRGDPAIIAQLAAALQKPVWTLYLGRKCCPPGEPVFALPRDGELWSNPMSLENMETALQTIPWRPRLKGDRPPQTLDCLLDWEPTSDQPEAPDEVLVCYDVPLTFQLPAHRPRFVIRKQLRVGADGEVHIAEKPAQKPTPLPPRPRADYKNSEYRNARAARLQADHHLCVFCKAPATTVQHVTYRRAGGNESQDDLRALCRLCHDAVTMIEYGLGMGLDRINPEEPRWRGQIIRKRAEIIEFRSLETRRRRLAAEEVE